MPTQRIERALAAAHAATGGPGAPPKLAEAIGYALFPGGARVRPHLALAVAGACGDDAPACSDAAAAAIEIMHCASLVHDDLPIFDDAATRRGKPSVHAAYGEPLALLAGDSMIVLAFEVLAMGARAAPDRLAGLVTGLARATGMPGGICAGQGWESEEDVDLSAYHQAKTGALFEAATAMGAISAGQAPGGWVKLGARIGEAYQVADDLRDALLTEAELGKPAGQDAVHDRPNAVSRLGVLGAAAHLQELLDAAAASIPDCPGRERLEQLVAMQAKRLMPQSLVTVA